jgi:hypothetical protein
VGGRPITTRRSFSVALGCWCRGALAGCTLFLWHNAVVLRLIVVQLHPDQSRRPAKPPRAEGGLTECRWLRAAASWVSRVSRFLCSLNLSCAPLLEMHRCRRPGRMGPVRAPLLVALLRTMQHTPTHNRETDQGCITTSQYCRRRLKYHVLILLACASRAHVSC